MAAQTQDDEESEAIWDYFANQAMRKHCSREQVSNASLEELQQWSMVRKASLPRLGIILKMMT
jgi:hypothetical protein